MRIFPAATVIIKIINKLRIMLCWTEPSEALGFFESVDKISDYSGQICTKNSELIVKNRLISYIQKVRFSSIIKKTRVLKQKSIGEKICGMTFNMYHHVFLIIFPNFLFTWKKSSRIAVSPLLPTSPRVLSLMESEASIIEESFYRTKIRFRKRL